MPGDLIVDELITWIASREVSVPTTASGGCFLGITVVADSGAGEKVCDSNADHDFVFSPAV